MMIRFDIGYTCNSCLKTRMTQIVIKLNVVCSRNMNLVKKYDLEIYCFGFRNGVDESPLWFYCYEIPCEYTGTKLRYFCYFCTQEDFFRSIHHKDISVGNNIITYPNHHTLVDNNNLHNWSFPILERHTQHAVEIYRLACSDKFF